MGIHIFESMRNAYNSPASRVTTTRKLYKSRRNIQYLDTLIEVKRFERCVGTQV
jgi:hypothetical protein